MTAGTSTGSILAAGLAYTNTSDNQPTFFAKDLIQIYSSKGQIIFTP
jgi:patatin-like phospholipase/acyl hydrolase